MRKVKFHYNYPLNIDLSSNKTVNVYIYRSFGRKTVRNSETRILILEEPKISGIYMFAQKNEKYYTHLLTFHEDLLLTNSKARLFNCVDSWVKNYVFTEKQFNVSTVVGGKEDFTMKGYALRHTLWNYKDLIRIPKRFYLSSNYKWEKVSYHNQLVLGESKVPMFDSMFHIAIENTFIANYFSEKLVDCFQTKTVPIYLGCTNIEKYFNVDGIIRVSDVGEIVEACNKLTPELYEKMKPAMEDNYNRSMNWIDHDKQIENAIIKLI